MYWLPGQRLNGTEYAISDVKADWLDAKDACHSDGAILAIVETGDEDNFLRDTFIDATTE